MVPPRLARGQQHAAANTARSFSRIEQQFGVPGAVIVAIWGLETDFGADNGNSRPSARWPRWPTIAAGRTNSAASCLPRCKIVDRGDMAPADMHGAWAGEIGQTQFLPSSYLKFAVDYDGNGRRDLIHSVPDVLASTANYLKGYGWQRGQPWGEGTREFPGAAAMERVAGLHQDRRLFRRAARRPE